MEGEKETTDHCRRAEKQHQRNHRVPFGGDGLIRVALMVGNPEGRELHDLSPLTLALRAISSETPFGDGRLRSFSSDQALTRLGYVA